MMDDWPLVSGLCFAASLIATAASIWLANRLGVLDTPDRIKIHTQPTPRLGGIGVFVGSVVGVFLLHGIGIARLDEALAALAGTGLVFTTGIADDVRNIHPLTKIAGQMLGAITYAAISSVVEPGSPVQVGVRLVAAVTAVVALSNSFNLLDGMNGLLAGVSVIAFSCGAVIASRNAMIPMSYGLVGVAAACLGFVPFNFPSARTFLGDSGSLVLGTVSALFLLELIDRFGMISTPTIGWLTMLSVPITDTVLAMIRRFRRGECIFQGDRAHMYDRLADMIVGNVTMAVILMWLLSMVTASLGLLASRQPSAAGALRIALLCYGGVSALGSLLMFGTPVRRRENGVAGGDEN